METLQQIIINKLNLIKSHSESEAITLEELLSLKKKQASNELLQSRIFQTILSKRVSPPQAEHFYVQSLHIMRVFDPQFQTKKSQTNIHVNTVDLYAQFFMKHDASHRAEKLRHIYAKKVCQKDHLLPTLFGCLLEWTRKRYRTFLKEKIQSFSTKPITKNRFLQFKSIRQGNFSRVDAEKSLQEIQSVNINKMKSLKSIELANQLQNVSLDRVVSKNGETKQQKIMTNKEVVYGAFYDEMISYYQSSMAVMPDLDPFYLRTIRKLDANKKEIYKKKLVQISKAFAKIQHSSIGKTRQNYAKAFILKFPDFEGLQLVKVQARPAKDFRRVFQNKIQMKKSSLSYNQDSPERTIKQEQRQTNNVGRPSNWGLPCLNQNSHQQQQSQKLLQIHSGRYKQNSVKYFQSKRKLPEYSSAQELSLDISGQIRRANRYLRVQTDKDVIIGLQKGHEVPRLSIITSVERLKLVIKQMEREEINFGIFHLPKIGKQKGYLY